jgi:hypothetical protein
MKATTVAAGIAAAFVLGTAVPAQQPTPPSQEELEAKLAEKLEKPFVANAAWVLDYAEAKAKAKAENKVIFAYFTRSYAY